MRFWTVAIDRDGLIFAFIIFCFALLFLTISTLVFYIFSGFSLFTLYFFRDPQRFHLEDDSLIISPADGKVLHVLQLRNDELPVELRSFLTKDHYTKVSIFMNVFNVHVNRAPCSGIIEKILYIKGRFFNASLDKASKHNERNIFCMNTIHGSNIAFVQIAGLIARRIRCDINEKSQINKGAKLGLIRFGSRVDMYLPDNFKVMTIPEQTTVAGESIIACTR